MLSVPVRAAGQADCPQDKGGSAGAGCRDCRCFRDALMLRIEENSTLAIGQVMSGVGVKTEEILQRLKETAKREVRQSLAEGLAAGEAKRTSREGSKGAAPEASAPTAAEDSRPPLKDKPDAELKPPSEDFETWLRA